MKTLRVPLTRSMGPEQEEAAAMSAEAVAAFATSLLNAVAGSFPSCCCRVRTCIMPSPLEAALAAAERAAEASDVTNDADLISRIV